MVDDTIRMDIYVYDPSRPATFGLNQNIEITIVNPKHISIIKPNDDDSSFFQLEVADSKSLGLNNYNNSYINEFMRKVILACNLTMKKAAFSITLTDPSHAIMNTDVQSVPPASSVPPANVEKTPTGFRVALADSIGRIQDSISVTLGIHDALDEAQFVDTLRKIQIVYYNISNTTENHNLAKALDTYLSGTTTADKRGTFRNLYSALEETVNSDGSHIKGNGFDEKVCLILSDSTLPIGDLREFNNRLKHPDNDAQRIVYENAIKHATQKIWEIRPIVTRVILYRLQSL